MEKTDTEENEGHFHKTTNCNHVIMHHVSAGDFGQCALISDNYSGQVPSSVCAPVTLTMDVRYRFILPVDPSRVEILYVWNDGTGATTLVPAVSQAIPFLLPRRPIYTPRRQLLLYSRGLRGIPGYDLCQQQPAGANIQCMGKGQ